MDALIFLTVILGVYASFFPVCVYRRFIIFVSLAIAQYVVELSR